MVKVQNIEIEILRISHVQRSFTPRTVLSEIEATGSPISYVSLRAYTFCMQVKEVKQVFFFQFPKKFANLI